MPSPYGSRSAATYYQHAGVPYHYLYNWEGLPPASTRAGETRALGDDYIDITADIQAQMRKSLGDYPVAMSMEAGRRSVLHSGPEQTRIFDSGLGLFGLSDNEKRLAMIAALGVVGYFLWKRYGK